MLEKLDINKILFLDIETVPIYPNYEDVDEGLRPFLDAKLKIKPDDPETFANFEMAGVYSEFAKIVCISVGYLRETRTGRTMRLTSFYHDDEETLLKQFKKLLEDRPEDFRMLCAHNGKEFDFPFICRRMLIHQMKIPAILDIVGKKPWEAAHLLDTMQLWKFGDYKAYTKLALLCHIFGIPTPKDDINGADVAKVYYQENNLERIKIYCEKDVAAMIQLFLKFRCENLIDEGEIHHI